MRRILLHSLHTLLFVVLPFGLAHTQSPPTDFHLAATSGGLAPWTESAHLTLDATGHVTFMRYITRPATTVRPETTFTIPALSLQNLWKAVEDNDFFSLEPAWADTTVRDGMFAKVSVTANALTHTVTIKNIAHVAIQQILSLLNGALPSSCQLPYTPPAEVDLTPKDPCESGEEAMGHKPPELPKTQRALPPKLLASPGRGVWSFSRVNDAQASHPGTVVACDVPLNQAVSRGSATVSSKGGFIGDDVSIDVNNQTSPSCDRINLTLYLEFYGSEATPANVDKVCDDIDKKWAGARTSDGKPVDISISTRTSPGAASPPNTPGYHQIELVPSGSAWSHVTGDAGVNLGTGGGKWEVPEAPGVYAHEAGHLMGLPDTYVTWNKQPDGSWVNSETGGSYPTTEAFAAYILPNEPGHTLQSLTDWLNSHDSYAEPMQGNENDLMADPSKPLRQSDIDRIASNPGLQVNAQRGTVLNNRSGVQQNLIIVRSDAFFAGRGESRTFNGIYAMCIDHFKNLPMPSSVLDVAPPVSEWMGIQSAAVMDRMVAFVDSAGLFCGDNLDALEAIWRISDNAPLPELSPAYAWLSAAGISLGNQLTDFPRLSGSGATDMASHSVIPRELYAVMFQPASAIGTTGAATTINATISRPFGAPAPSGISWVATGADGTAAGIAGSDTAASFTPARAGMYEIGLRFSKLDPILGLTSDTSYRKAVIVVPDSYTETFDHPRLADKYPWRNAGDVPWTLTSKNAQTGSFAARAGGVVSGETSTLGIEVVLPADTAILYAVRTFTYFFSDGITFSVDNVLRDAVTGSTDWTIRRVAVPAGRHLLTWSFSTFDASPDSGAWLDNIFFPGNVVVTSVSAANGDLPKEFALEQNFPNPFNPTTTIRYQLPKTSMVRISVCDILGREASVLVNERKDAGVHEAKFDGSNFASGVYVCRMQAGDFVQARKLILLR
jgi:hypothetical protein